MKIQGSELAQFMEDGWPGDDWYWDHEEFDGAPESDKTYDTDALGAILHQGSSPDPTNGNGYDLARLIRQWRKKRTHDVVTMLVPKALVQELKDDISVNYEGVEFKS